MALPTPQKTWIIDPCNTIVFVSLVQTMREYLFQLKEFLKLNGYTVRGSSDGTTASPASTLITDGVDRWVTAANAGVRGTVSAAAQSWIVLQDVSGVSILLAYQGAGVSPTGDDIARISFSPNQLFTTQATGTFQPTATDEQVVSSATSLIGSTASGNRVWSGWVDSTGRLCRFAIARAGIWVGRLWGIEQYDNSDLESPAFADPSSRPTWGYALTTATAYVPNGTQVGVGRHSVGGVVVNNSFFFNMECFPINGTQSQYAITWGSIKPELQGSLGYPIFPLPLSCQAAGGRGKAGLAYDVWAGRFTGAADGDTYGVLQFIAMSSYLAGNTGNGLWPWDGVTAVVMT